MDRVKCTSFETPVLRVGFANLLLPITGCFLLLISQFFKDFSLPGTIKYIVLIIVATICFKYYLSFVSCITFKPDEILITNSIRNIILQKSAYEKVKLVRYSANQIIVIKLYQKGKMTPVSLRMLAFNTNIGNSEQTFRFINENLNDLSRSSS